MAVSKGNQKKKKRTQNHRAPEGMKKPEQREVEVRQEEKYKQARGLTIAGIVVMIIGFALVMMDFRFVGYPITFIGGLTGLLAARMQGSKRKGTIIGYTAYCVLIAYLWIIEFT